MLTRRDELELHKALSARDKQYLDTIKAQAAALKEKDELIAKSGAENALLRSALEKVRYAHELGGSVIIRHSDARTREQQWHNAKADAIGAVMEALSTSNSKALELLRIRDAAFRFREHFHECAGCDCCMRGMEFIEVLDSAMGVKEGE